MPSPKRAANASTRSTTAGFDEGDLTPDHSTISRMRRLIGDGTRLVLRWDIFDWILRLVRIHRTRPKKGSDKDWGHKVDPDARIARIKGGSTHMAHMLEQAARAILVVAGRLWALAAALLAGESARRPRQTPSPTAP